MAHRIPPAARAHIPPGASITRVERMSRAFVKYHLDDGSVLHRFTQPEPSSDPHDHPFAIDIEVLSGGYVEEVFTRGEGGWRATLVHRVPGETHRLAAEHVHRVVELPTGECWTRARYAASERITCFWRFGDDIRRRRWNSRRWERV
ncbi:hypothetical protein [Sphingomonas bacterium]|uniref:hypothetical protein n=1 Tax=Sphingomonas bacterium TaxID=1895847 RepID=UPI001575918B|nr:hypothetical protein [Sphingomonas bacterium]